MGNQKSPIVQLVDSLTKPPQNGGGRKKKSNRKSKKTKSTGVRGQQGLGTVAQGPLMLKQEQFAAYVPLQTFSVAKGTTPGGVRVRGRELIQSLTSGLTTLVFGANNLTTAAGFELNPGNFPRLASYASIYEFYKFHKAKAMFQSNQPTTASGVSEIAVDYDAKDAVPSSTVTMMRNISSSMSNIYADNACVIDGSLSRLPRFVTSQTSGADRDQYIQAVVWYAFEGVVGTNASQGYLLIEYDVEFFTPQ